MTMSPSGKLGLPFWAFFAFWCLNLGFSFADVALWTNIFFGAEFFCLFSVSINDVTQWEIGSPFSFFFCLLLFKAGFQFCGQTGFLGLSFLLFSVSIQVSTIWRCGQEWTTSYNWVKFQCQLGEETEFVRHTNAWKGGHCIWNEEKDISADHLHFSLEWVVFF